MELHGKRAKPDTQNVAYSTLAEPMSDNFMTLKLWPTCACPDGNEGPSVDNMSTEK